MCNLYNNKKSKKIKNKIIVGIEKNKFYYFFSILFKFQNKQIITFWKTITKRFLLKIREIFIKLRKIYKIKNKCKK